MLRDLNPDYGLMNQITRELSEEEDQALINEVMQLENPRATLTNNIPLLARYIHLAWFEFAHHHDNNTDQFQTLSQARRQHYQIELNLLRFVWYGLTHANTTQQVKVLIADMLLSDGEHVCKVLQATDGNQTSSLTREDVHYITITIKYLCLRSETIANLLPAEAYKNGGDGAKWEGLPVWVNAGYDMCRHGNYACRKALHFFGEAYASRVIKKIVFYAGTQMDNAVSQVYIPGLFNALANLRGMYGLTHSYAHSPSQLCLVCKESNSQIDATNLLRSAAHWIQSSPRHLRLEGFDFGMPEVVQAFSSVINVLGGQHTKLLIHDCHVNGELLDRFSEYLAGTHGNFDSTPIQKIVIQGKCYDPDNLHRHRVVELLKSKFTKVSRRRSSDGQQRGEFCLFAEQRKTVDDGTNQESGNSASDGN